MMHGDGVPTPLTIPDWQNVNLKRKAFPETHGEIL